VAVKERTVGKGVVDDDPPTKEEVMLLDRRSDVEACDVFEGEAEVELL